MKRQKGFTLIELVMVIVILGILAAVAIPKYVDMQDEAKAAAAKGVIGSIRSAISIQYAKNALAGNAVFPSIAELTATGATSIFVEAQMPESPVDVSGNKNTVTAGTSPIDDTDCDETSAYVYDANTGEIRFNVKSTNANGTDLNGKAWNTY